MADEPVVTVESLTKEIEELKKQQADGTEINADDLAAKEAKLKELQEAQPAAESAPAES